MTEDKKRTSKSGSSHIDLDLGSLLGPLGEALGEMLSRLDTVKDMTSRTDGVFHTEKGSVRTQSSVRVRVGGLPGETAQQRAATAPVNATRPSSGSPKPRQSSTEPLECDLFEMPDGWMLTADAPGVLLTDLEFSGSERTLIISTTGLRRYRAELHLETRFDRAGIDATLRNGILEVRIPSLSAEGEDA